MSALGILIEREERIKRELLGLVKQAYAMNHQGARLTTMLAQIEAEYIPPLTEIQKQKREEISKLYTYRGKADLHQLEDWEYLEQKQATIKELDKEILRAFYDLQSTPLYKEQEKSYSPVALAIDHSQDILRSLLGKTKPK